LGSGGEDFVKKAVGLKEGTEVWPDLGESAR